METDASLNPTLLRQLFAFGEYLDAVDAGVAPIDAARYQACAQLSKSLIDALYCDPDIMRVCDSSWALTDLRENALMTIEADVLALARCTGKMA